jgi:hypothetical protein
METAPSTASPEDAAEEEVFGIAGEEMATSTEEFDLQLSHATAQMIDTMCPGLEFDPEGYV